MKIERNNISLEINKPEINFDETVFTAAENKTAKKAKVLLITTTVVAGVTTLYSGIRKLRKKSTKNK